MVKIGFQSFFVIFCLMISVQAKDYIFSGFILDKNGKPIPDVTVYVEKKINWTGVDSLIFTAETDDKGYFQLKKDADEGDVVYLELEPPSIAYTYFPIQAPFFKGLEKLSPQIFQKPIILGKSQGIYLGKLVADFPYPILNVKFIDEKGASALGYKTDFSKLWLKVFDKNKEFVGGKNFQNIQYRIGFNSDSEYQIALPRGKWLIKLCSDEDCQGVIGASSLIIVKNGINNISILIDK